MLRMQTKEVKIGSVTIGGAHPVAIQSMTNTKTEDVAATVEQILRLEAAGCEIVRCTVPTMEAAKALKEIKKPVSYTHLDVYKRQALCGEPQVESGDDLVK